MPQPGSVPTSRRRVSPTAWVILLPKVIMIRLIPRKVLKGDGSSVSSLNQGQLSQNVLNRHNMEQRLLDKIKAAVIIQQLRKNSAITQAFSNYASIQQLRKNLAITQEFSNYARIVQ
jgi:hypothetical protein